MIDIKTARKKGIWLLTEENAESVAGRFIRTPTPALDTDCLLQYILNKTKTYLTVHYEATLSDNEEKRFYDYLALRRTGLPIAYITGHKEFYGLDFIVTQDVLIPKPDTECLVELALEKVRESIQTVSSLPYRMADICTGSGCIAISVVKELYYPSIQPSMRIPLEKEITITATDISEAALDVARQNAIRLLPPKIGNSIIFAQGDLLTAIGNRSETKQTFDMIVSNPPYIPTAEVDMLLDDGRNEPRLALDGQASDGLAVIRKLIPQVYEQLSQRGIFLMETGEYNAEQAADLMRETGFLNVRIHRDLAKPKQTILPILKKLYPFIRELFFYSNNNRTKQRYFIFFDIRKQNKILFWPDRCSQFTTFFTSPMNNGHNRIQYTRNRLFKKFFQVLLH